MRKLLQLIIGLTFVYSISALFARYWPLVVLLLVEFFCGFYPESFLLKMAVVRANDRHLIFFIHNFSAFSYSLVNTRRTCGFCLFSGSGVLVGRKCFSNRRHPFEFISFGHSRFRCFLYIHFKT